MRVLDRSVYRGPNIYGGSPMIRFALDLERFADSPTNTLPGFVDALVASLPGLSTHHCSRGRAGGFIERLHEGTWLGHVVEHVALELQKMAGMPESRGKTRSVRGRPGVYDVLIAYRDEAVGGAAARLALELVTSLLPDATAEGLDRLHPPLPRTQPESIPGLAALTELARAAALGPTTQGIVDAARSRGIPVQRLDAEGLIRLGWGSRQRLLRASITSQTSHLGVLAAGNKRLTKQLLASAGVPVPRGVVVRTADDAVEFAAHSPFAVVTKPLNGNHGRGVSTNLFADDEVRAGFAAAQAISRDVIVEEHLPGSDFRVLVVGGRVVAVAERVPPSVIGDDRSTIEALIAELNRDPRRGVGHENVMTRVHLDAALTSVLATRQLSLDSVPPAGDRVVLRDTANLSTGGLAIDRTGDIHPDVRAVAERAARIVGLDVAGIDVLTTDIARPLAETGGGIVEVNAAPGFRMHLHPSEGDPRPVGEAVIDELYPRGSRSRIPVIAVTGTNGKSTVVRMVAHILSSSASAPRVGFTTTSGVYVDGHLVRAGDSSGPKSARLVLADPTVDVAVLETARGGLLREGLAYDRADVGVVLNVSADHLGLKGINSLRGLARVKSVIARRVRRAGVSVLNLDDRLTRQMASVAGGRVAFFTLASRLEAESEHAGLWDDAALLATIEPSAGGGTLTIHERDRSLALLRVDDIPATLRGAARFNVANALAAALATHAQRVPAGEIVAALASFGSSFEQNPGRMNITTAPGFTTIVDYAHNPAALRALGELIAHLRPEHDRVIGVVSTPGDRRDADILALGTISASIFDEVIFRELPDGRGRAAGGVVNLLSEAAEAAGMDPENIRRVMDEREAMHAALSAAGPRDLVVLTVSSVTGTWEQVQSFTMSDAKVRV